MSSRLVSEVTLICVDCVNLERAIASIEICKRAFKFENISLLSSLPGDYEHLVCIPPVSSWEAYSAFIIKDLHRWFFTPHCLIVQHDGWLCNASAWTDEWLKYDYIGCATFWTDPGANGKGGNGGFSLRSKKLMAAAAEIATVFHPEDMVLSGSKGIRAELESRGCIFAPRSVQKRFGIEFGRWTNEFGHHRSNVTSWRANAIKLDSSDVDPLAEYDFYNDFEPLWVLRLSPDGTIKGGSHPNESFWDMPNGNLRFLNKDRKPTTIFTKKNADGVLTGKFVRGCNHYLKKRQR